VPFQVHHVLPRDRYRHTPAFLGQEYSDDMILLEVTFITGRPKETRLALLKSLNEKIVAAVKISPADLVVLLYEIAGENPHSAVALRSEPTSRLRADHESFVSAHHLGSLVTTGAVAHQQTEG
jgi:hypothetical protein